MAFTYKLETTDGTPADPPTFQTVAWSWRVGDTIPLGGRTLSYLTFEPVRSRKGGVRPCSASSG
jgi:hypothetical protein